MVCLRRIIKFYDSSEEGKSSFGWLKLQLKTHSTKSQNVLELKIKCIPYLFKNIKQNRKIISQTYFFLFSIGFSYVSLKINK